MVKSMVKREEECTGEKEGKVEMDGEIRDEEVKQKGI